MMWRQNRLERVKTGSTGFDHRAAKAIRAGPHRLSPARAFLQAPLTVD